MSSWQTPTTTDAKDRGYTYSQGDQERPFLALPGQAKLVSPRATPTSRDHKDGSSGEKVPHNSLLGRQVFQAKSASGMNQSRSTAPTIDGVAFRLNPLFSLWLQGLPVPWAGCAPGWTDLATMTRLLRAYSNGQAVAEKDS